MKIVFNTRHQEAAASCFYTDALSAIENLTLYDWENYPNYDIALFMAYPEDLDELAEAKRNYSNLKIGLIDPRGSQVEHVLQYVDFLILDSLEMKDFFAKYQLPMFQYYEYPNIIGMEKQHTEKDKIIIGYHGNKIHIMGMYPHLTKALELLGEKYNIEFWAMYNIDKTGKCPIGPPRNIPVKHIQWSEDSYIDILYNSDIGIVPNLMPIKNISAIKKKCAVSRRLFNDSDDDYLIRFKMPSNPGRFIIFGKLGIPVVTDFYPSALQYIKDEENGMLAYSPGGWYTALEKLIVDVELRQRLADNMKRTIDTYFGFQQQNEKLLSFLKEICHEKINSKKHTIAQPAANCRWDFGFLARVFAMEVGLLKHRVLKRLRRSTKRSPE